MSETADRLLTVAGAAKFLTLAEQTIRNLTCKGCIPVLHIGRRCVYDREALSSRSYRANGSFLQVSVVDPIQFIESVSHLSEDNPFEYTRASTAATAVTRADVG